MPIPVGGFFKLTPARGEAPFFGPLKRALIESGYALSRLLNARAKMIFPAAAVAITPVREFLFPAKIKTAI